MALNCMPMEFCSSPISAILSVSVLIRPFTSAVPLATASSSSGSVVVSAALAVMFPAMSREAAMITFRIVFPFIVCPLVYVSK